MAEENVMTAAGAVVEAAQEETQEVSARALAGALEEPVQAPEHGQEAQEEQTPEQTRTAEIQTGMQALIDNGFTNEELDPFTQDADARRDVQGGMSVERAMLLYMRRQAKQAPQGTQTPQGKRGVPTVRGTAEAAEPSASLIDGMSDKQFDEFMKRATEATLAGKRVKV